MDKDRVSFW